MHVQCVNFFRFVIKENVIWGVNTTMWKDFKELGMFVILVRSPDFKINSLV